MEKEKRIRLISELSDAPGASGFEDEVLEVVRRHAAGLGSFEEDKMRNLYLTRAENRGNRLTVQLDAHTDEVGFMVQAILPNGCLKIVPIGGWVASNVPAHRVLVRTADGGYLSGVTGSKPPHFMTAEERAKAIDLSSVIVDVGTSSAEQTLALGIEIGEPVVPDVRCEYDAKRDILIGKAFDCRSGCASIIGTLEELAGEELSVDVVAAFSTQEEVGTRGAQVTAERVKPDLAIVFEGTPADDTFGDPALSQTKVHFGPMLRHLDARMITHPRFQRFALEIGKELGIPVQRAVRTGGSTNGAPIHLTGPAVPTIVIGIPVRYIHTHYGIASLADHERAAALAAGILRRLNGDVYDAL